MWEAGHRPCPCAPLPAGSGGCEWMAGTTHAVHCYPPSQNEDKAKLIDSPDASESDWGPDEEKAGCSEDDKDAEVGVTPS